MKARIFLISLLTPVCLIYSKTNQQEKAVLKSSSIEILELQTVSNALSIKCVYISTADYLDYAGSLDEVGKNLSESIDIFTGKQVKTFSSNGVDKGQVFESAEMFQVYYNQAQQRIEKSNIKSQIDEMIVYVIDDTKAGNVEYLSI